MRTRSHEIIEAITVAQYLGYIPAGFLSAGARQLMGEALTTDPHGRTVLAKPAPHPRRVLFAGDVEDALPAKALAILAAFDARQAARQALAVQWALEAHDDLDTPDAAEAW